MEAAEPLLNLPRAAQWCVLIAISAVAIALLEAARMPAALLLGSMIAGILVEIGGGRLKVPRLPFSFAQAVIGCMIARVMSADILGRFLTQWPLFLGVVLAVIAISCLLGFVISKLEILPGTTAIWGLLPGAASIMMLMAGAFGADIRLVAFIQYLRVVFVAVGAALFARVWMHVSGSAGPVAWFPAIHWVGFAETLGVILLGVVLGPRSRIPAGVVLVPMIIGSALHMAGLLKVELPPWFLAVNYLVIGWSIGLRFTRETLVHAVRALPQTVVAILALMTFCGVVACLLVRFAGIDPLTAYLATSPGGMDSAAIIAASSKVDMPFVMALQIVRFLLILLIGPPVSRWLAGKLVQSQVVPDKIP